MKVVSLLWQMKRGTNNGVTPEQRTERGIYIFSSSVKHNVLIREGLVVAADYPALC